MNSRDRERQHIVASGVNARLTNGIDHHGQEDTLDRMLLASAAFYEKSCKPID